MSKTLKIASLGDSSFVSIREAGCVYVDKTRFIEALEKNKVRFPFIVRPRRFGKTLFVNTLEQYYDKAASENFNKNFAGTYIHAHKTPLQGQFYVMRMQFAGLSGAQVEEHFLSRVIGCAESFFLKYPLNGY